MNWEQVLVNLGGGGAAVAAALTALRSKRVRIALGRLLSDASGIERSLSSLQKVVEAQGESIDWLRGELDLTRRALDEARSRLQETENLAIENVKLRARVAELELHVARLEVQLNLKESQGSGLS